MALKPLPCATFAAAILAGTLVAGASSANAACRGPVRSEQISGISQAITEVRARASWRNKVRAIHGYRFARWGYARNKNMACNKAKPGRTWYCRAIASPCDRPPRSG
jgi:hypothetical protein